MNWAGTPNLSLLPPFLVKYLITFFLICFLGAHSIAQSTPAELGQKLFFALKHDSVEKIFQWRLKNHEVPDFLISKGIDTGNVGIKTYLARYGDVTATFESQTRSIRYDTLESCLSWKAAEILNVTVRDRTFKQGKTEYKDPNVKFVFINFRSNEREFTIFFEAMYYKGAWMMANSITCRVIFIGLEED